MNATTTTTDITPRKHPGGRPRGRTEFGAPPWGDEHPLLHDITRLAGELDVTVDDTGRVTIVDRGHDATRKPVVMAILVGGQTDRLHALAYLLAAGPALLVQARRLVPMVTNYELRRGLVTGIKKALGRGPGPRAKTDRERHLQHPPARKATTP